MNDFHFSVDIETLGLTADSVVLTIAAVPFDPYGGIATYTALGTGHVETLSPPVRPQILAGRRVDPDTVAWWRRQTPKAAETLIDETPDLSLRGFYRTLQMHAGNKRVTLWANPAVFDLAVLRSLWVSTYPGEEYPIHHMAELDGSTLQHITGVANPPLDFMGTPHIAVDDAIHQAREIQWQMQKIQTLLDNGLDVAA